MLKKCIKHIASIYEQRDVYGPPEWTSSLHTGQASNATIFWNTWRCYTVNFNHQKAKSHSTSSEKQTWNKENVEKDLRDWPVGTDLPKPLVSTQRLWMEGSECTRTWRVRMPGGEICVPTHLNSTKIRSFYSCYQPRVDLNGENVRWWRAWLLKRLVS